MRDENSWNKKDVAFVGLFGHFFEFFFCIRLSFHEVWVGKFIMTPEWWRFFVEDSLRWKFNRQNALENRPKHTPF